MNEAHTNSVTGDPCCCDRPENRMAHAVDSEIRDLFEDLGKAQQRAIRTLWSMECDWIAERISVLVDVGGLLPAAGEVGISLDLYRYACAQVDALLGERDV